MSHSWTARTVLSIAIVVGFIGCGTDDVEPPGRDIVVSPLALEPSFSTSIHDYAVRCAPGTNRVTIDMIARGGTTRIVQPTSTDSAESQAVDVDLVEDEVAVVEMAVGHDTDHYWIRCLPHDFPVIVPTHDSSFGPPSPGWYLVSSTVLATGTSGFAMVLDANGTPDWYRR